MTLRTACENRSFAKSSSTTIHATDSATQRSDSFRSYFIIRIRTGFWLMPAKGIQLTTSRSPFGKNAIGSKVPERNEISVTLSEFNPQPEEV